MFSYLQKTLYSLSAISPLMLCGSLVWFSKGIYVEYAIATLTFTVLIFLLGGVFFLRFAEKNGEELPVAHDQIAKTSPGGQWLSVLFGSYLIPIIGLLGDGMEPVFFVAVLGVVAFCAAWFSSIPPAAFLLFLGYRFYEIEFANGAGGFKLISKRKSILKPNQISGYIFLFKDDYWLLERGD